MSAGEGKHEVFGGIRSDFSQASLDVKVQGEGGPRRGHWEGGWAEGPPQKASGSVRTNTI